MGTTVQLTTADGHVLNAYRSGPEGAARALVVIQEIFGVNHHIRTVCDRFAAQGYAVIAPALFDRVAPATELTYEAGDVAKGRELRGRISDEATMHDVAAAAAALNGTPHGIVGYCWGGTVAWWGATRARGFRAAVGWYGGGIAATRTETPSCPVQLHFGENDSGIPLSDVDSIRESRPGIEVFVYPGAQHGFGCDERASFDPASAALAQERTLAFLDRHV